MSRSVQNAYPNIANLIINPIKYMSLIAAKKLNINAQDKHGKTALHWAVETSNWFVIDYLYQQGADANIADNAGCFSFQALPQLDLGGIVPNKATRPSVMMKLIYDEIARSEEREEHLINIFEQLGGSQYEDGDDHTFLDYLFLAPCYDPHFLTMRI